MATKKYDFKLPLRDAEDKPVIENDKEVVLSNVISNVIMNATMTEAPMKFFDWALDLKKTGSVTLDDTDKETFVKFITGHPHLPVITKGRLLKVFSA